VDPSLPKVSPYKLSQTPISTLLLLTFIQFFVKINIDILVELTKAALGEELSRQVDEWVTLYDVV
jgi:hypothetical protein